jgi:fused signal recognition particle receptor
VAATLPSPAPSTPPPAAAAAAVAPAPASEPEPTPAAAATERKGWLDKLKAGLRKTGSSLATVFTGTRIDDELYEELETALLMADTGVKATEFLLADLKRRVKENKTTDPAAVKGLLADAITDLLAPLQKVLVVGDRPDNLHNGQHGPTVIMVAGVNGAGKTTSIGKLTKHLATSGASVLLAAADTFRAAAREQLAVWADRNLVEIISQQGGDPAAVSFDAVSAGRARGKDVVLVDTAGRLPTQLHLMEELKKIKRVVQKADATAPHEVLLVIDGNTGQNALAQVKAFDDALALTGLVITKLDGTAKGGVLCAIAREKPVPVYFIGVGEKAGRPGDLQRARVRAGPAVLSAARCRSGRAPANASAVQRSSPGSFAYWRHCFIALRMVSTWRSKRGQAWHIARCRRSATRSCSGSSRSSRAMSSAETSLQVRLKG